VADENESGQGGEQELHIVGFEALEEGSN